MQIKSKVYLLLQNQTALILQQGFGRGLRLHHPNNALRNKKPAHRPVTAEARISTLNPQQNVKLKQ